MNAGTPASVALPDRSSRGMIRSTSTRTVAYSCGVKKLRLVRAPALRAACRAACGMLVRLPRLGVGPCERRGAPAAAAMSAQRRHVVS